MKRKIKGLLIETNQTVTVLDLDDDYIHIRDVIGAQCIDVISAGDASFYVDDEGFLVPEPIRNPVATVLYRSLKGRALLPGGYIHGNVLVLGPPDGVGNDTDVPDSVLTLLGVSV